MDGQMDGGRDRGMDGCSERGAKLSSVYAYAKRHRPRCPREGESGYQIFQFWNSVQVFLKERKVFPVLEQSAGVFEGAF